MGCNEVGAAVMGRGIIATMTVSRRAVLIVAWILSDALLFVGSCAVAYFLQVGWILSSDLQLGRFLTTACLSAIPWLMVLGTTRAFAINRQQATVRSGAYIAYACLVGIALVALMHFFLFQQIFSRRIIVLSFIVATASVWVWHIVYERIQRAVLRRDPPSYPLLVVGVTRESRALLTMLEQRKNPLRPVGILDAMGVPDKEIAGVPVLGKLNKLGDVLQEKNITHLLHCSDLEQSINLLSACRSAGVTYMVLPSVFGIVERGERVDSIEGKPVTVVRPEGGRWQWFLW
jgi:FlaA1/EpsC-like NDP-sugar epimerase